MPGSIPLTVVLVPVPLVVAPPGLAVRVHEPEAGSPLKITEPVDTAQVGWVMAPTFGAVGTVGAGFIVAWAEDSDRHPVLLVTVQV